MIKEKSCGAVVYKKVKNQYLFLVEHMAGGHFSLPKGHVEPGETEIQTAIREVKEETNLDIMIVSPFRNVVSYSPYQDCIKDVVFFLGEAVSDDIVVQEEEVRETMWLEYYKAFNTLTYQADKETIQKARRYLEVNAV